MEKKDSGRGRKRKLTPRKEQQVYNMRKSGISVTEVAFKNGISTKTVQRIINRINEANQ